MSLQFIVRNWRLKLVALAVACGMWVAVVYAGNPPAIRTVYIPVQANGLNSNNLLLLHNIARIPVKVDGVLSNVTTSQVAPHLSASVNLSKITRPGEYQVPLTFANTDPNVSAVSVPSTVQVVVDDWKTARLTVHVIETGLQAGYSVSSTAVNPTSVLVRAPSSILSNVVVDAKVNLSPYRAPVTLQPTVTFVNPGGLTEKPTADPNSVSVKVGISSQTITTGATALVETTGDVANGYELVSATPAPLQLSITGPETLVAQMPTIETRPIDISGITRDTSVQVQLVVPSGVTASVTTVTVTITVVALPPATPTPTPTPPTPTPSPSP